MARSKSTSKNAAANNQPTHCRLDLWLWAARFFKTRKLAQQAVQGGKVEYNGQRCKASKNVSIGAMIQIPQGYAHKTVAVTGLSEKRGNAQQAALLYEETEQSITQREALAEQRKMSQLGSPQIDKNPSKHTRRQLRRMKHGDKP